MIVLVILVIGSVVGGPVKDRRKDPPPFRHLTVKPLKASPQGPENMNSTEKFVFGEPIPAHSTPYLCYIICNMISTYWSCVGTLITEKYVLTTAHCLHWGHNCYVRLGVHHLMNYSSNQISIYGIEKIAHNLHTTGVYFNIGVIKLKRNVNLSTSINVATLPKRSDTNTDYIDSIGTILGWGQTANENHYFYTPRRTTNQIINGEECRTYFEDATNKTICMSGAGKRRGCAGDAGGPLIVNDVVIGIFSFGALECRPGYPMVFTRITSYIDWLETTTNWRESK